jgi:hypothetical protein
MEEKKRFRGRDLGNNALGKAPKTFAKKVALVLFALVFWQAFIPLALASENQAKFRVIAVPIGWDNNNIREFRDYTEGAYNLFVDIFPFKECPDKIELIRADHNSCNDLWGPVGSQRGDPHRAYICASRQGLIPENDPTGYGWRVVGIENFFDGQTGGYMCSGSPDSPETKMVWVTSVIWSSQRYIPFLHELGHTFGLCGLYCGLDCAYKSCEYSSPNCKCGEVYTSDINPFCYAQANIFEVYSNQESCLIANNQAKISLLCEDPNAIGTPCGGSLATTQGQPYCCMNANSGGGKIYATPEECLSECHGLAKDMFCNYENPLGLLCGFSIHTSQGREYCFANLAQGYGEVYSDRPSCLSDSGALDCDGPTLFCSDKSRCPDKCIDINRAGKGVGDPRCVMNNQVRTDYYLAPQAYDWVKDRGLPVSVSEICRGNIPSGPDSGGSQKCGPIDDDVFLEHDLVSEGTCFQIQAEGLTIDCQGKKITYATKENGHAIYNPGHNNLVVRNCVFEQGGSFEGIGENINTRAIYETVSEGLLIEGNTFYTKGKFSQAIGLKDSKGKISGNILWLGSTESGYGLNIGDSQDVEILGNTVNVLEGNGNIGILLDGSAFNKISDNNLNLHSWESFSSSLPENFKGGFPDKKPDNYIAQFFSGIYLQNSPQNILEENSIYLGGNRAVGIIIIFSGSDSNKISQNTIEFGSAEYAKGIIMIAPGNEVFENTFSGEAKDSVGITIEMPSDIRDFGQLQSILANPASISKIAQNNINLKGQSNIGIDTGKEWFGPISNITQNKLKLEGQNVKGIQLSKKYNSNENEIDILGDYSFGIILRGSYSRVAGNNISISGDETMGIYSPGQVAGIFPVPGTDPQIYSNIFVPSQRNLIKENKITSHGSGATCIGIIRGNDSIVSENTLNILGEASSGAVFQYSYKTLFQNNTISIEGLGSKGAVSYMSNYTTLTENKITSSAYSSRLIDIIHSEPVRLTGCILESSGIDSIGVAVNSSNYVFVYPPGVTVFPALDTKNNIIRLQGDGGAAILLQELRNSEIRGFLVETEGESTVGIGLEYCENLTLAENQFSTPKGPALYITPSQNISHYNHSIDDTNIEQDKPIYYYFNQPDLEIKNKDDIGQLYLAFCNNAYIEGLDLSTDGLTLANSNKSKINNCSISTKYCDYASLALIHLDNASISNSSIKSDCENSYELWLYNATNITITNTTYSNSYIDIEESYLERYWHLSLNVTDSEGNPVEGAEVTCADKDGKEAFSEKADGEGKIKVKTLLEYIQTGAVGLNAGIEKASPYLCETSKSGYADKEEDIELSESKEITIALEED